MSKSFGKRAAEYAILQVIRDIIWRLVMGR